MKKGFKRLLALCLTVLMTMSVVPGAFAAENENNADASTQNTGTVTYAIINDSEINAPGTEEILVGIGDESTTVDSASLTVYHQESGALAQYDAAEIIDGAVKFQLNFSAEESGTYALMSVSYAVNNADYTVDFEDVGIQAVFGVNASVTSEPDAYVVDSDTTETDTSEESEANVVFDVTTIDNGGSVELASSVEDALYDAASNSNAVSIASLENEIAVASSGKEYVVVLDPGHGTHKSEGKALDCGTSFEYNGVEYLEKDITLKIAQYCKQELEQYSNVTVYMTRTGDYNGVMSISDRVDLANEYGTDILVSIHINSAGNGGTTTARGAEVYYPNSNGSNGSVSAEAKELSRQILNQLVAVGMKTHSSGLLIKNATEDKFDDGTEMDYFGINRYSKEYGFPGIIVEHGFLNNESDFYNFLSSDEKLQKLGVADATGIANYLGLTKKNEDKNYTIYDGIEYAAVYNYDYYTNRYPEVVNQVGSSPSAVLKYFVEYGMSQHQQGSAEFDPISYRYEYASLRQVYGDVWAGYYRHYARWGKAAGLHGTGCTELQGYVTMYSDGIDYSGVYDYNYYVAKYPEVAEKCDYDEWKVLTYFVEYGLSQHQQGSAEFDPISYRYEYASLRQVYGDVWAGYYRHYARWGKAAGLHGTGCTELQGYVTMYSDGIDYSGVYDYNYYVAKYPEVAEKCDYDEWKVLTYFVEYGLSQHQQGSAEFDPISYRYEYASLRQVYGDVWAGYYRHYARWGKAAGLHGTGCTEMQGYVTKYSGDGLDYASVYDYNFYVASYPEIAKQCDYDDYAVLAYFVETGMWQKQQGSSEFNVDYYRTMYSSLQSIYGEQWAGYYRHYVRWGKAARWSGNGTISTYYSIMGAQSTTVTQMVSYLNSKHISFDESLYGMTLQQFCQLYLDECSAEGVDAAVALCQSMLETGWLKYGGQVQAAQLNFAGIKTADGSAFQTFGSVREGIRAQVQHLKAYASTDALVNTCVDPRFNLVRRGTAPYVEWLCVTNNPNGTGWTSDSGYSEKIIKFINELHKA